MRSKFLLLTLFTVFLVPEQFLISQIKFAVIGDFGNDNNGEDDVAELVNGLGVDVCFDTFRSVELLFEIRGKN